MRPSRFLAAAFLLAKPLTILGLLQATSRNSISPIHLDFKMAASLSSLAAAAGIVPSSNYFTVGITGSSGLVGSALRDELAKRNVVNGKPVRIVRLVRGDAPETKKPASAQLLLEEDNDLLETSLVWNPAGETAQDIMDPDAAAQMDAIVHLSGESVATGMGRYLGFLGLRPWTQAKKDEILNSRIGPTRALAKVVAASQTPKSFLVASGIGIYGDTFMATVSDNNGQAAAADESYDTTRTPGFLADVSRQWEAASALMTTNHQGSTANNDNSRVVNMRLGVVLSKHGGALAKLYPVFWLGGGGTIGSGRQYFSFISARDVARAIVHTLETPCLHGPVNFSSPFPCTNEELTKAIGQCIGRPTILPFPAFAVKTLFGEMGQEMLLGGTRAVPNKLVESGFQFNHPTIHDAISSALEETV